MATIASLNAVFGMNTSGFEKGAQKISKKTKQMAIDMNKSGTMIKRLGNSMRDVVGSSSLMRSAISLITNPIVLLAGAVSAAALSFSNMSKEMAETADASAKFSRRIGANFEEMQKLAIVNTRAGNTTATLNMAFQRMTRRVSEAANGMGEARAALKELGLDARFLTTLKPDEMFKKVAEAMESVPGKADKIRLSMKLFDSEGVALVNTMENLNAELDRVANSGTDIKRILTEREAAVFERMNDSAKELGDTLEGSAKGASIAWAKFKHNFNDTSIRILTAHDRWGKAWNKLWETPEDKAKKQAELFRRFDLEDAERAAQEKKAIEIKAAFEKEERAKKELKKQEKLQLEFSNLANAAIRSEMTEVQRLLSEYNKLLDLKERTGASGSRTDMAVKAMEKRIDTAVEKAEKAELAKKDAQEKEIARKERLIKLSIIDAKIKGQEKTIKDIREDKISESKRGFARAISKGVTSEGLASGAQQINKKQLDTQKKQLKVAEDTLEVLKQERELVAG